MISRGFQATLLDTDIRMEATVYWRGVELSYQLSAIDQFIRYHPIQIIFFLNVENKIFFSVVAGRLMKYLLVNKNIDVSIQKGEPNVFLVRGTCHCDQGA